MKIVNRITQSDKSVMRIWFDGLHYWAGDPPKLTGPFTSSDLHSHAQQENLTADDSTITVHCVPVDKTPKE